MTKKILIYIEKGNNVSEELAKKAQELACQLGECEVIGVAIGFVPSEKSYFDKIYFINDERLKYYSTDLFSKVVIDIVKEIKPEILFIGATCQGRDLAPRIASTLHTGLTADCTSLEINNEGKLAATRPTFGGKLMATILSKNKPQMATVRPNVIKTVYNVVLKDTEYIEFKSSIDSIEQKVKLISFIEKELKPSIENSEIIIAGGVGVKDNLELLYAFADKIGASVGVTRSIVDLGLASSDIQIGQTGKNVSPKLYIACGISGAIQHTVGIMGAKRIIAINKDENAPIFKLADFGIVGDAVEILSELIAVL